MFFFNEMANSFKSLVLIFYLYSEDHLMLGDYFKGKANPLRRLNDLFGFNFWCALVFGI